MLTCPGLISFFCLRFPCGPFADLRLCAPCMPAANNKLIRGLNSETLKHAAVSLLTRCFRDKIEVEMSHIPAMLQLSAPGEMCAWCGVALQYAYDGYG